MIPLFGGTNSSTFVQTISKRDRGRGELLVGSNLVADREGDGEGEGERDLGARYSGGRPCAELLRVGLPVSRESCVKARPPLSRRQHTHHILRKWAGLAHQLWGACSGRARVHSKCIRNALFRVSAPQVPELLVGGSYARCSDGGARNL